MAISEAAKRHHDELSPDHASLAASTDFPPGQ